MRDYPSNSDDVIDSRNIIERLEELESERESLVDNLTPSMLTGRNGVAK